MVSAILRPLHILRHLIFKTTYEGRSICYLSFKEEETEVQRG